jgi:PKD repeat protein
MVSFMITPFGRPGGRFGLALGVLSSFILATGCNKVPLLAPTGSSITLTASATTLPINGATDLIAQVLEASGTPPQDGTLVTFTTNLGTVQPPQGETSGGRVIVKFHAGATSGEAKIVATSGGAGGTTTSSGSGSTATTSSSNAVSIKIGGAAVDNLTLSATPAAVSPNGGTVTLTAAANDVSGNRLPGVPVTFTATAGNLSATVVDTDQNGIATTALTTTRQADVTATAGAKTSNKVTIGLNTGPAISLSAPSPASPSAGQVVTFTVTLTAPGATGAAVRSVIVDFGDGSPPVSTGIASTTPVSHTFNNAGTYTVRATATDANGETGLAVSIVVVGLRPQPTVTVTAAPQDKPPGTVVTVTATATPSTGTTIQSLTIDFGDGQSFDAGSQASAAVPHVYQTAGSFSARATARDSGGGTGTGATVVVVTGTGAQASFTVTPASPTRGQPAAFDASASTGQGGITNYSWDFGDGAVISDNSPTQSHTYPTTKPAGGYNVRLTVTDAAGHTSSAFKSIVVQ